jgi:hypothetical protein
MIYRYIYTWKQLKILVNSSKWIRILHSEAVFIIINWELWCDSCLKCYTLEIHINCGQLVSIGQWSVSRQHRYLIKYLIFGGQSYKRGSNKRGVVEKTEKKMSYLIWLTTLWCISLERNNIISNWKVAIIQKEPWIM